MLKQLFEITEKVQPNVQFFRLLTLMVLASVIITKFPWMNGLLARVINIPDIRHNITYQPIDNDATLIKADIANLGQVKADNALFHFQSRSGKITGYFIESQDSYDIEKEDFENGILNIKFERLAPGARIYIELTGYFDQTQTYISVTSDEGSSINTDLPSFSSQVQGYATSMTSLYERTTTLIEHNLPFTEQQLTQWGEGKIIGFSDLILFFKSDDFKTILSATVVLSLLIGLFLPHLAWLIPIIAALGVGLLANFQLSAGFIIAVTIITFLPGIPTTMKTTYEMMKNDPRGGLYSFILWLSVLLSPFLFWETPTTARWLAIPIIMIVLYLLLLISIIIPKEGATQPIPSNEHRVVIQTEQTQLQDNTSIENLHTTTKQITDYLKYVEQQLSEQQATISQLSQRYSVLVKAIRKGDIKGGQEGESIPPHKNA
jgi:hypothetical protein